MKTYKYENLKGIRNSLRQDGKRVELSGLCSMTGLYIRGVPYMNYTINSYFS